MLSPTDESRHPLAEQFRAFIRNAPFPCVGAKSALGRGTMRVMVARDIAGADDDGRVHAALMAFVCRYRMRPDLFQSLAVLFEGSTGLSEERFETRLWERVQALSDLDSGLGYRPDARVSDHPEDPHFSLSLAGEAFFVVGLHPGASRQARRFRTAALVFNPHDQFEQLRADGRYDRLRETIRARDASWTGSHNPMLTTHGERSEAIQYSGRAVPEAWRCPFRRQPSGGDRPLARDAGAIAADLRQGAFRVPPRAAAEPRR